MRRTIVIDDALLKEAQEALGTDSIRATVEQSLREAVRRRRLEKLSKMLGTMHLAMTSDELLRLRHEE